MELQSPIEFLESFPQGSTIGRLEYLALVEKIVASVNTGINPSPDSVRAVIMNRSLSIHPAAEDFLLHVLCILTVDNSDQFLVFVEIYSVSLFSADLNAVLDLWKEFLAEKSPADYLREIKYGRALKQRQYVELVDALIASIKYGLHVDEVELENVIVAKKLVFSGASKDLLLTAIRKLDHVTATSFWNFVSADCDSIFSANYDVNDLWLRFEQRTYEPSAKRRRFEALPADLCFRNWTRSDRPVLSLPQVSDRPLGQIDAQRYVKFDACFLKRSTTNWYGPDENITVYVRDMFLKQLQFMQSNPEPVLVIRGPPGCGQSTCMYLYALSEELRDCRVYWLSIIGAFVLEDGFLYTSKEHSVEDAFELYKQSPIDNKRSVWILDGYDLSVEHSNKLTMLIMKILKSKTSRLIINPHIGVSLNNPLSLPEFLVPSWTLQDYRNAYADESFRKSVEKIVGPSLEQKFFYAGGSCLNMFGRTIEQALQEIVNCVRLTPGVGEHRDAMEYSSRRVFGVALTGEPNNYAGDFQDTQCIFMSDYFIREVAICNDAWVLQNLYNPFENNTRVSSFVFPMWCLSSIKRGDGLQFTQKNGKVGKFNKGDIEWYASEKLDIVLTGIKNKWLAAERLNGEGYEMIQLCPKTGLVRVLVIANPSGCRTVDCDCLKATLQRIRNMQGVDKATTRGKIKHVECFVVVPSSIAAEVELTNTETSMDVQIVGVEFPNKNSPRSAMEDLLRRNFISMR